MSEKTTNYQFTKLDEADISTIVDMNGNADKIDAALKINHDEQQAHNGNKNNPHQVTKAQVGLGNVDNTADLDKPISMVQQNALRGKADLGVDGKIPAAQLPSYVDDVLEFNSKEKFPQEGETGKIYVAIDANLTYRWTGVNYVEISPSLALGETASTAYSGDKGKQDAQDIAALKNDMENFLDAETLTLARANGIDTTGSAMAMLNRIEQLLLINPIIEEADTSDGWHIRKYANGRAEATITGVVTQTFTNLFFGGYESKMPTISLPKGVFASVQNTPLAFASTYKGGNIDNAYVTLQGITWYFVNSVQATSAVSVTYTFEVFGKWK